MSFNKQLVVPIFAIVVGLALVVCSQMFIDGSSDDIPTRGLALVAALKEYQTKNGKPPDTLQDLVPNYLTTIPTLGGTGGQFYYTSYTITSPGEVALYQIEGTKFGGTGDTKYFYRPDNRYNQDPTIEQLVSPDKIVESTQLPSGWLRVKTLRKEYAEYR